MISCRSLWGVLCCGIFNSNMNRLKFTTYIIKYANKTLLKESGSSRIVLRRENANKTPIRFFTSSNTGEKDSLVESVEKVDLTNYGSEMPKYFNIAMVADKSPVVQKYIDLGVDLYEVQKKPEAASFLLTLNSKKFNTYLLFLTDNGVPADKLGNFITVNPTIFKEDLEDLEVRINYLKSKKFDQEMISKIITNYPKWLSFPVKDIDDRLGYLQRIFLLKGDHVRKIITQVPSLVAIRKETIMTNFHTMKEDMNFNALTIKKMVISEPQLLRVDPFELISTFQYLTKTMNVSRDLIVKQAKVLNCRKFILQQRHKYLEALGRAQYNHLLPGYVNLLEFATLPDVDFCSVVAQTSYNRYTSFLKTL